MLQGMNSNYSRAERGRCSEQTVVFLLSAVLLPLSTMHLMVASVRGRRVGWMDRRQFGTGDSRISPRADS